jgi:2-keto-4-pentenoate hydratase/2-oxohepta-3-ene-1,7-dioic acid hydratase in catechol pathway
VYADARCRAARDERYGGLYDGFAARSKAAQTSVSPTHRVEGGLLDWCFPYATVELDGARRRRSCRWIKYWSARADARRRSVLMRLGTAIAGGRRHSVVERDGRLFDIQTHAGGSTDALLADGGVTIAADAVALEGARLTAPLRPGKIVAIGLNYRDHVRETGLAMPKEPLIFAKFSSSVIGSDEPIIIDDRLTARVDWEVELAAVIGRRLSRVSQPERALEHVFGYTVANDVSARDLQFADGQWVRGKSLDTFCPLGPVIVTADEISDPQQLALRTRVNDEVVQDSSTAEMIFGIGELIAFCSQSFTLDPGDVVLTGTPWGCGEFMSPRRSLIPGDIVEVEIEGIGRLSNPVVAWSRAPA